MTFIIVKDRFYIAREEIRELERLLQEARFRQRRLLKQEQKQGWFDWLWELVGY